MSDDILSNQFSHEKRNLEALILTTATELFAAHGYHKTSLNLVALSSFQEVKMLFSCYSSKERLLVATLEKARENVDKWFQKNSPTLRGSNKQFQEFLSALIKFCQTKEECRFIARMTVEVTDENPKICRTIETTVESLFENTRLAISGFCDADTASDISFSFLTYLFGAYTMERVYRSNEFIEDACLALNTTIQETKGVYRANSI